MRYMGSKRRIVKDILSIIEKREHKNQTFVEPFCGGCNVTSAIGGERIAADIDGDLIAFWKKIQAGWLPTKITRAQYIDLRAGNGPDYLRAWAAYGCSFRGKKWGGFAGVVKRKNGEICDYQKERLAGLMKQAPTLAGVKFIAAPFDRLKIPPRSLIYCDPPYAGTTDYKTKFDHVAFWQWCREKVKERHAVYVSEYAAPSDFVCVWAKTIIKNLHTGPGRERTEKLFVHKTQVTK